jgi:hypothetical protein
MKRTALVVLLVLLLLGTIVPAARTPEEYPITVHLTSSYFLGGVVSHGQGLDIVIDGKKYALAGDSDVALLALGDYKAKLVKDEHKTSYESFQEYEILFPDKKTRKFTVVGQSEGH